MLIVSKKQAVRERVGPGRRAGRLASAGVIREAATELFLRSGYLGTSMEEIATLAGVSKQTVYTHFTDKERLFTDLILGITDRVDEFLRHATDVLEGTEDLEADLRQLARRYLAWLMRPELLQLRRLVIGEAGRFPGLARTYYERAPERTLNTLASGFKRLAERGLLRADEPRLVAEHFAYLVLGASLDRAMFCGVEALPAIELDRRADAAVEAFLTAYARATPPKGR
jgi:TetR/AcrR family transcriptional regulator, mexJK operon transcriptional repressor